MVDLSVADRDLWRAFRRSAERINAAIERDLILATKLSGSDHGILSRLAETKNKALRQQELCDSMRWDRTRLSHHLTRMQRRGLVKRTKLGEGATIVSITSEGNRAREAADPVHADAVMRYFISKLTVAERQAIASVAATLTT
jgi:DNA-binding MarR family transcriptional regulator